MDIADFAMVPEKFAMLMEVQMEVLKLITLLTVQDGITEKFWDTEDIGKKYINSYSKFKFF